MTEQKNEVVITQTNRTTEWKVIETSRQNSLDNKKGVEDIKSESSSSTPSSDSEANDPKPQDDVIKDNPLSKEIAPQDGGNTVKVVDTKEVNVRNSQLAKQTNHIS